MSVARAVAIFSPQVTSVLRFLLKHAQQLGFHGFDDSLPTIEFMELVYKWFTLHNIKSTSLFWMSRDALRMPFYGPDDERLLWLENECLIYFDLWKESTAHNLEFLSEETYEALRVTTMSTVLCTRHLLGCGFHFVLTGKFSSDDVESLFSTIRQLNGSNDQTDAYAALSSLQKILVTGCIHSSPSGNVGSVIGSIGEATKLAPQPAAAAPPDKDIKKLLLPYLTAWERFPKLDGYLKSAKALVKELTKCTSCRSRGEAEEEKSGAAKKMAAIDRPAVLKQMVSATLPTSADARGPQRTCDPHCESPDLRVTPHLQAEKKQGPCLASRTSRCSPACPAEEDRPVYSCSPAGPSSKPGSGTATQLLFCWSDPDVVELQPESSIFVETGALHAVLNSAKTPTALARGLLPAVFNWHALLTCSMKGQKAKGMHKPVTQRPPLHAAAIDAILGLGGSVRVMAEKMVQDTDKLLQNNEKFFRRASALRDHLLRRNDQQKQKIDTLKSTLLDNLNKYSKDGE
ncbi:hypothetical protein MRX96_056815 [Rhipicephalus microplus]